MPSPQKREEALFQAAVQLAGAERVTFLNGACLGDPALRQRLEALLAAHEAPDELSPAVKATIKLELADAPDEAVGQTLGRYKLMERLGEGGCGVVYVAEQTQPVRRRVALKVIKLGMDTKAVVARFEAERQALAMMDHPNIAKVLDAGTTDLGRPFFVMELVRGIRITDYCDQNQLSTQERLDLFIKVCQAIQHAHQKGIIHRDIKPSNILVTLHDGVPVPKVIDFGIAKATEGRLTDATVYTQLHQFIGTPAYMSPEQAEMSGLDIDTRSDIYSLGVLLYELLAGSTPFDAQELMSQGIDQMRKTIREKEPVRPSTRFATLKGEELTTTAKRRSADKSKLMHQLKGDLDWIVMKCLEKDRTRRYDTATGLAADLKRHLNNEPVVARPPSTAYRIQKAVRRNKISFAAGTIVFGALLLGIIATTWQSVRATHAKREALVAQSQAVAAQAGESIQRQKAEANEQQAVAAQANETKLREQAEAEELAARQKAYASDMKLAQSALAENNLGRAQELLNRQRPQAGQKDLRGWEWRYLWQYCQSDALYELCQKTDSISSLSVSHDGEWLAVGIGMSSGPASVWNLRNHQEIVCPTVGGEIKSVTFSPQSSLLALLVTKTNSPNDLHLWDVATRKMAGEFPLDGVCLGLAFSEDGRKLVTESVLTNEAGEFVRGQIAVWQMPEGKKLSEYSISPLDFEANSGTRLAVSRNGGIAAFAKPGGNICVIDLATGKESWMAKAADDEFVMCVAFSPDGKVLATGAGFVESAIRLWDVASGKEIKRLEGHRAFISSLVFWPDGKTLASASGDQTIRLWDLTDISNVPPARVLQGHKLEVWKLALLPDNITLVSGSKDGSVLVWDTSAMHSRHDYITLPDKIDGWCFGPDGRSLLTANLRAFTRWTGTDFQEKAQFKKLGEDVYSSIPSTDGKWIATVSTNNVIQVWDLQHEQHESLFRQFMVPTNFPANVNCFIDQDKTLIVTYGGNDDVEEWDIATGKKMRSWQGIRDWYFVRISPNGQFCVTWRKDDTALLRNLADGNENNLDLNGKTQVSDLSFSPDGKLLAVASMYGFARMFDVDTQRELATLHGFLMGVHSVAFSPDGTRLALGSDGREAVKLWDVASLEEVATLGAQGSVFLSTKFSPDGNVLGSLNDSGVLYLWRAPSWDEINGAEAKEKASTKQP
jgi:WD40 repeat protein/serine/threonine protein kinase